MSDRIGHEFFISGAILGQLLFCVRIITEDVKPPQHVIIIRIRTCSGIRIVTPDITEFVISAADIHRDAGIINRCHCFYPDSELSFEQVGIAYSITGDKVAGKHHKIDIMSFDLSSEFVEDCLIDSVFIASAVAGDNKFPWFLCKTCRRTNSQKECGKDKLYWSRFYNFPSLLNDYCKS